MTEKIKKVWYKRWWAITIFIFFGLVLIGGLFGEDSPQTNAQASAAPAPEMKETGAKVYSMGDEVQTGDLKWKITKAITVKEVGEELYGGAFFGEKADGIFIILNVEVENMGQDSNYLSDSYIILIDEQGREFSANTAASFYLKPEGSALAFEEINPGIKKKGRVVYDVPTNINTFKARVTSGFFSTEKQYVQINL